MLISEGAGSFQTLPQLHESEKRRFLEGRYQVKKEKKTGGDAKAEYQHERQKTKEDRRNKALDKINRDKSVH